MIKLFFNFFRTEKKYYLIIFLIGIITRFPFLEHYQSHWDGPDYSIGISRYSFAENTPTEPGYPLYIAIGYLFNIFVSNQHYAILLVSVLFSGIGAVVAFFAGNKFFSRKAGVVSAILYLSSPTFYYFGITANPYGLIFTTSSLMSLAVYLIFLKKQQLGKLLALTFIFAIGIRPQDVMFLLPLFLLGFYSLNRSEKIKTIILSIVLFLLWFIPVLEKVGGLSKYMEHIGVFFSGGPGINISIERILSIAPVTIKGFYLTFTFSLLFFAAFLILVLRQTDKIFINSNLKMMLFFSIWIFPSFLFNIFVRSDHAAHQITYLSGFIYLISFSILYFLKQKKYALYICISLLVIINLLTFFRDRDPRMLKPYVSQSYHYSEIIKNNKRMSELVSFISRYDADSTIVMVEPEIFRQLTYYLRNYKIYSYSSIETINPVIIDTVHYGYDWHYKNLIEKSHSYIIPLGIKKIIVVPNNKKYNISGSFIKTSLRHNAELYILDVKERDRINISLKSIKVL